MDTFPTTDPDNAGTNALDNRSTCQSTDWYHEGQTRTVEVNGVIVTIRYIGRNGRRARIAITAPAGASFLDVRPQQ